MSARKAAFLHTLTPVTLYDMSPDDLLVRIALKALEFYTPPAARVSHRDPVQHLIDAGYISANDRFAPERILRPTTKGVSRVMRELIPLTDRDQAAQTAQQWEALLDDRYETFHRYHQS